MGLEVGVELAPVGHGRKDSQFDNLVAELAEVLVALFEFSLFGGSAFDGFHLNAVLVDGGLHSHQDVVELVVVYVSSYRPTEGLATHSSGDCLDGEVRGALERRASTKVDDVLSALDNVLLDGSPVGFGKSLGADEGVEGFAVDESRGCENGHLLAVSAVCAAILDLGGGELEPLHELILETSAVEGSESGNLRGFEAGVDESDEAR